MPLMIERKMLSCKEDGGEMDPLFHITKLISSHVDYATQLSIRPLLPTYASRQHFNFIIMGLLARKKHCHMVWLRRLTAIIDI